MALSAVLRSTIAIFSLMLIILSTGFGTYTNYAFLALSRRSQIFTVEGTHGSVYNSPVVLSNDHDHPQGGWLILVLMSPCKAFARKIK